MSKLKYVLETTMLRGRLFVACTLALALCGNAMAEDETPFSSLEKLNISGGGIVMVHPELGMGSYDAVRFTSVSLGYVTNQKPLSKKREAEFKSFLLEQLVKSATDSGTAIAKDPGACTVNVAMGVVNINFNDRGRKGGTGKGFKKSLGSATLAYDMRDSVTGEKLVFLADRRDFGSGRDRGTTKEDFQRLKENVSALLVETGQTLGVVVEKEVKGRVSVGKEGCKGALGRANTAARQQREAEAKAEAKSDAE